MLDNRVRNSRLKGLRDKLAPANWTPGTLIILLIPFALLISFIVVKGGIIGAAGILAVVIGIPIVYGIIAYPEFGITVLVITSFLLNYVSEFLPNGTPTGILLDAITYMLIFGFFLKKKYDNSWDYFKNPISYLVLAWLAYNFLEAVNPVSPSILAWVYTVRTVGFIMLMYFIFLYQIQRIEFIKFLFKLWLALCLLAAISGFQQENFGFFGFEKTWYYSDPARVKFWFINGHWRKTAIFADPVTFSYNMVVAVTMCICFVMLKISSWKKVLMVLLIPFYILAMLYSGTRGAYVLLPAALALLAILKFDKKIVTGVVAAGFLLLIVIFMPTSNPTIKRFQSAFNPSKDASFNVRAENQRRIKPYILSHPIGGGLGSVGVWGRRFAPNSFLANFPPDSGYVRVAVEMGYIGLILFCTLMFVILKTGINNYYLIQDPELKNYCLAMILVIFVYNVGNYPQQALVQYPSNILFYMASALLSITLRLDIEKRKGLTDTTAKSLKD
jgi:O-antigen ligase